MRFAVVGQLPCEICHFPEEHVRVSDEGFVFRGTVVNEFVIVS